MSSYGKACLQCTKAKVRCANNGRGPCERCTRLKKECQPAPRTRTTKGTSRVDRHSALEAKVNSLVELLKQNQTIPDEGLTPQAIGARAQAKGCGPNVVTSPLFSLTMQASKELQADGTSPDSYAPGTSVSPSATASTAATTVVPTPELPPETDDELQDVLDTYREKMFQFFPIMPLGHEVTVEYLATQRPFVWLILRAICTKKFARQLALSREAKQIISQKLIIDIDRNFDMLLGLVLYSNWCQFFCTKANLSPTVQLAIGLAGDLGLTKPVPQSSPGVMLNWTCQGCPKPPHALVIRPRTMEERRVVLGLFLVSSVTANFFQRSDPMRWTPYLEESLNLLLDAKEYPTDELLVQLIRIQLVNNGMHAEGWNEAYPSIHAGQGVPRTYYTHLHKMQLDEVKRSIPTHLQGNPILRFHLTGAEVTLYEQNLAPAPVTSAVEQTRRVEGLWACFKAAKSYFDMFFSTDTFPLLTYVYISLGVYAQLGHCLVALFRLSTFEAVDVPWDRQRIVSELDLADVINMWVQIFDKAPEAAGIDITNAEGAESQWEHSKRILLTTIHRWWLTKVRPSIMDPPAEERAAVEQPQTATAGEFDASILPGIDIADIDFNFDNDVWMRDLMNSGFDFRGF